MSQNVFLYLVKISYISIHPSTDTWNFPNQEHSRLTTGVLKIKKCYKSAHTHTLKWNLRLPEDSRFTKGNVENEDEFDDEDTIEDEVQS